MFCVCFDNVVVASAVAAAAAVWRAESCKMCECEKPMREKTTTYYGEKQQRGGDSSNGSSSNNIQKRRNIITTKTSNGVTLCEIAHMCGRVIERKRKDKSEAISQQCHIIQHTHTRTLTYRDSKSTYIFKASKKATHQENGKSKSENWCEHTPDFTTAAQWYRHRPCGYMYIVQRAYTFSCKCSCRAHYMHTFSRHVSNLCVH